MNQTHNMQPLRSFVYFLNRIGHENFELINHDVVEPLYVEGKVINLFLHFLHFHITSVVYYRIFHLCHSRTFSHNSHDYFQIFVPLIAL